MEIRSVQCPTCQEQVPPASFCTRCGASLKPGTAAPAPKKKGHRVQETIGIIALVLIGVLVVYVLPTSGSRADNNSNPNPLITEIDPTATPARLRMTIGDLQREYDANQLAADAKFEGKWMQVTGGEILNITPTTVLIHYSGDSEVFSVWALRCKFDDDDPTVLSLSRGQTIDVFGQNDGMSMGQVNLNHCSFISISEPPATPIPAPTSQPEPALSESPDIAESYIPELVLPTATPAPTPDIPATMTVLFQPTLEPQPTAVPAPTPSPTVLTGRLSQVTTPFHLNRGMAVFTTTYKGGGWSDITIYLRHESGEDVALISHGYGYFDSPTEIFIQEAGSYVLEIDAGDGIWTVTIEQPIS